MGKVIAFSWSGVGGNSQGVRHRIKELLGPGFSQSWKSRIHTSAEQTLGQKEKKPCWVSASRVWVSQRQNGEESATRFNFSTWEKCAVVFLPFGLFPPLLIYY